MDGKKFFSYRLDELRDLFLSWGWERYRSVQVADWVYKKGVTDFSHMTNLPKTFRDRLSAFFSFGGVEILREVEGKDGARKYLLGLEDGQKVEAVALPSEGAFSLCISTQVGCRMGCKFCATGKLGFKRNLEEWEIVSIFYVLRKKLKKMRNLLLMGMGEPLDNWENVSRALYIFVNKYGFNLSPRRIIVSTVGLPNLEELAKFNHQVSIAFSLNAVYPEKREEIMPAENLWSFRKSFKILRNRFGKKLTLEYVLFKGFNDSKEEAEILADYASQLKANVNLIRFHPHPACTTFTAPSREEVERFQDVLRKRGCLAFIRKDYGEELKGACGQLGLFSD